MKVEILYEDKDIIVVVKPAGMASQSEKGMEQDMVSYLKTYLMKAGAGEGKSGRKEGSVKAGGEESSTMSRREAGATKSGDEPYIGVVHRLDKPVGGVMVYAKTKEAAADLSEQIKSGTTEKCYQAVIKGELPMDMGVMADYMDWDKKNNMSVITKKANVRELGIVDDEGFFDIEGYERLMQDRGETSDLSKLAVLDYEVLDVLETDQGVFSYVLINLHTGRHHQIRCQLASRKVPIYGDRKYDLSLSGKSGGKGKDEIAKYGKAKGKDGKVTGIDARKGNGKFGKSGSKSGRNAGPRNIGLTATRLAFDHPVTGERMVFKTEPIGDAFDVLDAVEEW